MASKESLEQFINDLENLIKDSWSDDSINQIMSLWQHTTRQNQIGKSQQEIKTSIEQSTRWFSNQLAHKIIDKYGVKSTPFIYQKNIYKHVIGVFPSTLLEDRVDMNEGQSMRFFILHTISDSYIAPQSIPKKVSIPPSVHLWKFIKITFFGFVGFLTVAYIIGYRNDLKQNTKGLDQQEFDFQIKEKEVNVFKNDFYFRVVMKMPVNRSPTLIDVNHIFEQLLEPGMNKLSLFVYLPKGFKSDDAFASCLKTKKENLGCRIINDISH